jgi:hypothetical protein
MVIFKCQMVFVGRYEKSKMLFVFFYQYYIWNYIIIEYNGDQIYVNMFSYIGEEAKMG